MINYNFAMEWAVLPILVTIIFSFRRDYDAKNIHYRILKITYYLAFLSSVLTIATSFYNGPLDSPHDVACGYLFNTLYFMFLPSTSAMYGVYVFFASSRLHSIDRFKSRILPLSIVYGLYLLVLLTNIHNGQVFSVTPEAGYVRGPLYQLPFPVVAAYVIWTLIVSVKQFRILAKDTLLILVASMTITLLTIVIQFCNPNTIVTGLLNTTCILIVHLYVLNVRKTEDPLTGVQNRLALLYQMTQKVKTAQPFSLHVFSLRGMKQINEQYGLQTGDKQLHYIANTILQHVPRGKIFRYSGDEFALLLPNYNARKSHYVERLEKAFQKPAQLEGVQIPVHMITVRVDYPVFGTQVQDLISAVDYGIYLLKNKNKNGNRYLYDTAVADEMRSQSTMTNALHDAIANHRFEAHYQPIFHVPTGTFTQAEALIRLRKQDGTLVYPGDFIELANSTGLVVEMTYQLLDQVCKDFRALLTAQPDTTLLSVSINVPYMQFTDPDMERRFQEILGKYQISPRQIKIEITERIIITDLDMMIDKMNAMIAKGFEFELDDFGTDYSNLQMSLTLPMEIIKLDRSVLLAATSYETDRTFFQYLLAGINSTGRKTLIEGVESQYHLRWATECHCEYIQGYYFSRPVEFQQLSHFLQEQKEKNHEKQK